MKRIILSAVLLCEVSAAHADQTYDECKAHAPMLNAAEALAESTGTDYELAYKGDNTQPSWLHNFNVKLRAHVDAYKSMLVVMRGVERVGCVPANLHDKWIEEIKENEDVLSNLEADLATGLAAEKKE